MKFQYRVLLFGLALVLGTLLLAHDEGFPEATLKSIFPSATGFTPRQRAFTPSQVNQIEQASASKLQRNDNPLRFYVALGKSPDGSGVLGTVVIVDAIGPNGHIDMALGITRDGTIERVIVTENADERALGEAAFLNQFTRKSVKSPLVLGKDIAYPGTAKSAEAVLDAVRRSLHMLAVATGK
jgi:hypothetical protein